MGELLDFLVWLKRKGDHVPIQFIQAIGIYTVEFLEEKQGEWIMSLLHKLIHLAGYGVIFVDFLLVVLIGVIITTNNY